MVKNLVNVASLLRTSSSVMSPSYSLMFVDSLCLANLTYTVQYEHDDVADLRKCAVCLHGVLLAMNIYKLGKQ